MENILNLSAQSGTIYRPRPISSSGLCKLLAIFYQARLLGSSFPVLCTKPSFSNTTWTIYSSLQFTCLAKRLYSGVSVVVSEWILTLFWMKINFSVRLLPTSISMNAFGIFLEKLLHMVKILFSLDHSPNLTFALFSDDSFVTVILIDSGTELFVSMDSGRGPPA